MKPKLFLSSLKPLDHFDHHVVVRSVTLDFFSEKKNNNIHLGGSFKTIYNQYIRGILKRVPLTLNKRFKLLSGLNQDHGNWKCIQNGNGAGKELVFYGVRVCKAPMYCNS